MLKLINPLNDKRWDEFVQGHPQGTIFHTSNWAWVIKKTYGYEPFFLIFENTEGIIVGMPFFLIRNRIMGDRLVCLPFTDESPPLLNGSPELIKNLDIIEMIKERIKIKQIEIRGGCGDFFTKSNFITYKYYKTFHLDLSCALENLWKNFRPKSIRYPIKKAQNLGVEVVQSTSRKDIPVFYRLNLLTRKRHGVFPQPFSLFLNIYEELISKNYGFMLIAYYKSLPIAGSIFFTYNHIIHHKFNASHPLYLKYQPNHLILWTAIQWGRKNSYNLLDLGRTAPDNSGLMAFKRHWGAEEFNLSYFYWPKIGGASSTKESSPKYKIVSSILKRIPIPILKFSGNLFYKYLG